MNATMEPERTAAKDTAQEECVRHLDAVYAYLRALVAVPHDAEDLTQEVFRKAAEHWTELRRGEVRGWLFTTARNEAMQYFRRRGSERRSMTAFQALLRDANAGSSLPDEAEVRRMHAAALAAIETLEPQERDALRMKFVLALSNVEIATALKLTPSHLGVLLFRALKKVRQKLEAAKHD